VAVIAYAVPILPGQSEAAASFQTDLDAAGLRGDYEALNSRAQVRRHLEWVEPLPSGDLLVVVLDTDAPHLVARRFEDTAYDRWWRERVERIHGFDPDAGGVVPKLTWSWKSDAP
jgi:hypothetical protein